MSDAVPAKELKSTKHLFLSVNYRKFVFAIEKILRRNRGENPLFKKSENSSASLGDSLFTGDYCFCNIQISTLYIFEYGGLPA